MEQEIIYKLYVMWSESQEYTGQSEMENECEARIVGVVGEQAYNDICDDITKLACRSEYAGFENGLRYGVMFMNEILQGGPVNGTGKGVQNEK